MGEILDYGPGSRRPLRVGAKVTAIPATTKGKALERMSDPASPVRTVVDRRQI